MHPYTSGDLVESLGLRHCTFFGKRPVGYKRVCPYVPKRIGVIHSDRKKMNIGRQTPGRSARRGIKRGGW